MNSTLIGAGASRFLQTRLAPDAMRSDQEIRAEIEDIEARTGGSYEEQAGAVAALEWVLGYSIDPIRSQFARDEHVGV